MNFSQTVFTYWTNAHVQAAYLMALNIFVALIYGLMLGYERTYRGRAAGMRTYGLVCMVSASVVSINAFPDLWYGTQFLDTSLHTDPTRTIQGILTGIGFLCAGVIMREGFSISGLTTAASIWAVSAVGILVGVGFHLAAFFLVVGGILCLTMVSNLEAYLPARSAIAVRVKFRKNFIPDMEIVRNSVTSAGFLFTQGSFAVSVVNESEEWNFVVLAFDRRIVDTMTALTTGLRMLEGVEDLQLSHSRN